MNELFEDLVGLCDITIFNAIMGYSREAPEPARELISTLHKLANMLSITIDWDALTQSSSELLAEDRASTGEC